MGKERIELCCHTNMSTLQGINGAREYIEEAIKRGNNQIAITDKNSTQGFFEADEYFSLWDDDKDFKVIYGSEIDFKENEDSERKYSIYIYVKEQKGLKNLYKIVSKSYENLQNGEPVIYRKELNEYRDGLLYAAIGKNSEIYQNIDNSDISKMMTYYDFVGIEPNKSRERTNKKIYEICKKSNKLIIGTSECNFINKEDYRCNEVLNYYNKSKNVTEGNESYFQTTEELIDKLGYIENVKEIVVDNTIKIANQIEKIDLVPVRADYPKIPSSDMIISKKCYDKAYELYGKKISKDIEDRLQLELNSIIENNFETIYLISSELVEYSNKLGYEVGTRGSIGCSLVAFLLGITNINPMEYKLPFELFAGKNYDKEPDIDLNFSGKVQGKIFKYMQKKYGKDRVIWGGTIGTLSDRTVLEYVNEYEKEYKVDLKDKKMIAQKVTGVKKVTGEHPGGVFIVQENQKINDFCPTEIGKKGQPKTHNDYHSLDNTGLYKFDILGHNNPTILHELEKITKVSSKNIDLKDKETFELFLHINDTSYKYSTNGIPEFESKYVKKMIEVVKPKNINDLICISALSHGTDTWNYNAETLSERDGKKVDEVISNREDLFNYLLKKGIDRETAFDITEFIRKGKAEKGVSLWQHTRDRYKEYNNQWEKYIKIMKEHNIPEWYIKSARLIKYIFPKSHAIGYTLQAFKIAWYKVHYPEAFYKVYFNICSDLNIKDYYCIRQVKTELNRLYDKKEKHEYNQNYDYNFITDDKINDLEIVLEMFNRGILKEKEELKDDYNLINSRAIGDYCRSIKHKFNTEELAVLVYRNKRMSVDEKIDKYNDLIKNYSDMEVIERINCNHYDSVKTMIKKEIQRLNILRKKLMQDDKNSVCVWTELNKSTLRYETRSDLEHTFRTYKEAIQDIKDYIKEFDDTISFKITKKYFDKRKGNIYADYLVKNKKIIFNNIIECSDDFLDIDQIFLNIPTPFEKGDILIQTNKSYGNYNDYDSLFVLEYLCTWREDLEEFLKEGNYDSSDMIGYGYYLCENSLEFVRDHKWDYDSFEYYDGELKGNKRLLKTISSLIKEKIDVELYTHIYDYLKNGEKGWMVDYYTAEGLKLAGFTDKDIDRENHYKN